MSICSKCGINGEPLKRNSARLFLGTSAQFRSKIMKCPKCLKLFCGTCSEFPTQSGTGYKCPDCSESLQPI
jgi:hypothetical protein